MNKKYRLEESNEMHLGLIVMQDGKEADAIMPVLDFIGNCNKSRALIDPKESEFLAFTSNSFETVESYNNYVALVKQFNAQLGDFVINLKRKGGVVTIPDSKYFLGKYKNMVDQINAGRIDRDASAKSLTREFCQALTTSIERNKEAGAALGLTAPTKLPNKEK